MEGITAQAGYRTAFSKQSKYDTDRVSSIEALLHPRNHLFRRDIGGLYVGAVEHVDHVLESVLRRSVQLEVTRLPPEPVPTHREVGLQLRSSFAP